MRRLWSLVLFTLMILGLIGPRVAGASPFGEAGTRVGGLDAVLALSTGGIGFENPGFHLGSERVGYEEASDATLAARGGASTFTDPAERSVATYLEGFGRKVSKNPMEGVAGAGRQGDAYVDGVLHEFKTLDPGAGPGTVKNVVNNSIRGGGQAREIVIDARGSGLSMEAAQQGVGKALGISRGKVDGVTMIGDGYFFRWSPR